jgi:hypothetical protein
MLILFCGNLHRVQMVISLHMSVYPEHFLSLLTLTLQMKAEYFLNFGTTDPKLETCMFVTLICLHRFLFSSFSNIWIYKIHSLTQLSVKQLLLRYISYHISQLHVSSYMFRLETCSCEIWCEIYFNNNCLTENCVRLYILYICILLFFEHDGDISPENLPLLFVCHLTTLSFGNFM